MFSPGTRLQNCVAITAYDFIRCPPQARDQYFLQRSSYPTNYILAYALLPGSWLVLGSIGLGALGTIGLTILSLVLPLRYREWEKPQWLEPIRFVFVGLLSWYLLLFGLWTWIFVGAVWMGAIGWLRQKTKVLGVIILTLCLLLCPIVGHWLLGPQLILGLQIELSGPFMALFADGFVISGMTADYVSMRL